MADMKMTVNYRLIMAKANGDTIKEHAYEDLASAQQAFLDWMCDARVDTSLRIIYVRTGECLSHFSGVDRDKVRAAALRHHLFPTTSHLHKACAYEQQYYFEKPYLVRIISDEQTLGQYFCRSQEEAARVFQLMTQRWNWVAVHIALIDRSQDNHVVMEYLMKPDPSHA